MSEEGAPVAVSLVLGSGGARGYAHIGVIEELEANGFAIRSIAGSSMGALIGGIYAAGKLRVFTDWVRPLQRLDVLRLLDWTISGGGFIKGDRIIGVLKDLIGSANIEELDPKAGGFPVLRETRDAELRTVMSNSFGFGGTNGTLVFAKV